MQKTAQKIKNVTIKGVTAVTSLKDPKKRKQVKLSLKYRLFLLERRWMLHPILHHVYPKPGLPRRVFIGVLALMIVGSSFLTFFLSRASADWYSSTWLYRKQITLDKTKVPSTQTNFPVMVSITDTSLAANTQSNGNDILFTSSDGTTKLSHEIESYDSATGKLVAWVKVPTLSATTNTIIYIYYGNASAPSQQDKNNVWTGTSYASVLHLNQSPLNSAPQMLDSTSNNVSGTANGSMTDANKITAIADGGLSFNSTSNYVSLGDVTATHAISKFSMSGWIRKHATGTDAMIGKLDASCTNQLEIYLNPSLGMASFQVSNAVTPADGHAPFNDTQWHHFAMVFDGTQTGNANRLKGYIDGVQQTLDFGSTTIPATTPNTTTEMDIAQNGVNACSGYGNQDTDEVRMATTNLSPDWIQTEFNNEATPSAFMTLGVQQQRQKPVLYWKFDEGAGTTINDASGNSNTATMSANATWKSRDLCLFEGNCIKFNGSNSFVSRGYSSDTDLNPGSGSFSVGAWFRHPSGGSGVQTIVSRVDGASVNGIGYKINYNATNSRLCFGIDDTAGSFSSSDAACANASYSDNKWHYVEGVKNGTTNIILYVDGMQAGIDGSLTSTGSLSGSSPPFIVGMDADGTSNAWNGFIDEVKYYDYARSSSDIKADYTAKGSMLGVSASFGLPSPSSSLNNGLVGYWPMDDSQANQCPSGVNHSCDNSGNGNDGTWNGNVASTSGKFGNATKYNGSSDYIQVNATNLPTTDFTYSVWVNPTTNTGDTIFFAQGNSGGDALWINVGEQGTGLVSVYVNDNILTSTTAIPNSQWSHIVATRTNGIVKIYINGTAESNTLTENTTLNFGACALLFGAHANSSCTSVRDFFMNGKIDDARIYNRALSPREIVNLYDWAPPAIGYWKLDDRSSTTIALDSSGNNNNGTISNPAATPWAVGKVGAAMNFDSNLHTKVDAGSPGIFNNLSAVTASAWVYPRSKGGNSEARIVDKTASTGPTSGWYFKYDTSTQGIMVSVDCGGTPMKVISSDTLPFNQWSYATMTWDGGTSASGVHIYINGKEVGYSTQQNCSAGRADDTTGHFKIGDQQGGNFRTWDGYEDDVKLYNYVQTSKQIISDMNVGHSAVGNKMVLGYWNFDEGYGTTLDNLGGCGTTCNGTLTNFSSPSTVSSGWNSNGKVGKSLRFDGVDDYVTFPNTQLPTGDFTYSAWINLNTVNDESVFMSSDGAGGNEIFVGVGTNTVAGKLRVDVNGVAINGISVMSARTWNHIVVTRSGSTVKLFVNGNLDNTGTEGTILNFSTCGLLIGVDADTACTGTLGNYLDGMVDEARVYNYALTDNEVKLEYNQSKTVVFGAPGTNPDGYTASFSAARAYCPPGDTGGNCAGTGNLDPGPVGEWNLEEGTGTTTNDTSGNGNTGTLSGGPGWATGKVGKALSFTSSNSVVDAGSAAMLDNLSQISIGAWIYPTATTGNVHVIAQKAVDSNLSDGWRFFYDPTVKTLDFEASFSTTDLSVETSNNTLTLNTWQYVTVTWNRGAGAAATNVHIYNNGLEQGYQLQTSSSGTYSSDASRNLTIGNATDLGSIFTGVIDQAKVYNYIRTPAQIAWDYNRGRPTGYWKLDDCTGATAYDASGFGNNGTLNGSTTNGTCTTASTKWGSGAVGKFNSAISLDGSSDYVATSNYAPNAASGVSYSTVSWGGWVNPSSTPTSKTILHKNSEFKLTTDANGKAVCTISNNGAAFGTTVARSSNALPANLWTHVFCTYDGTTIRVYLNGRLENSTAFSATVLSTSSTAVNLGRDSAGSGFFAGKLDDMRIYNYTLNATQIRTLINGDAAVRFGPVTGSP